MNGKVTIRLAAVQARSLAGQIEANLEHAEGLVEQAAARGATVVVLPELFSCGYVPNRGVRDAAEARGGRADRWLAAMARPKATGGPRRAAWPPARPGRHPPAAPRPRRVPVRRQPCRRLPVPGSPPRRG